MFNTFSGMFDGFRLVTGAAVIVTSSLGVLQAGKIEFYPKMEPAWFDARLFSD